MENDEISEVVKKGAITKEFLDLIRKVEDIALDRKTSKDKDEGEEISDLEEMGLID